MSSEESSSNGMSAAAFTGNTSSVAPWLAPFADAVARVFFALLRGAAALRALLPPRDALGGTGGALTAARRVEADVGATSGAETDSTRV